MYLIFPQIKLFTQKTQTIYIGLTHVILGKNTKHTKFFYPLFFPLSYKLGEHWREQERIEMCEVGWIEQEEIRGGDKCARKW